MKETLTVHAYDWTINDNFEYDEHVSINAWCLDRDSNPYLLRFHDFPAFCHIELPLFIRGRPMRWDEGKAKIVVEWLQKVLGEEAPVKHLFKYAPKLYFYRGGKKYPMLLLSFNSNKSMFKCENLLKEPKEVPGIGMACFKVWETNITIVRKMLSLRHTNYSQWFTIEGNRVAEEDKLSTLKHEYICNWRTMTSIDPDISKSWMTHPRVLSFDIESYSDNHKALPNKYNAKHVAYMISVIYQQLGKPETRKKYLIIMADCNPIEEVDVIHVKNETELCNELGRLVRELDPEIITGYNIFGYDYPYLDARLKRRLQDWPAMGRLKGKNPWISEKQWKSSAYGHQDINILNMDGRISIDMLPIIRRDYKFVKYDLDTVSKELIGRGKHDVKAKEMFHIYEQLQATHSDQAKADMTRVARYCVEDAILVLDILEKTNTWIGLVELSNIVGVTIMELFTRGQQLRCLSQIYDLASKLGFIIDRKDFPDLSFSGGFVYEPTPNLEDYIICLDFKSLYPSIIQAFNICYTTLVPPELDSQIPDDQCHIIEWDEVLTNSHQEQEEGEEDEEDPDIEPTLPSNVNSQKKVIHHRFKFVKQPIGVLPQLVKHLVDERNNVRNKIKKEADPLTKVVLDKRQLALKVSANSLFGFLGVRNGKLPLPQGAMSITAKGRELITFCNNYLIQKYLAKIIYNDTDSTMFKLPFVHSNQETIEWGERLEKEISSLFPDPLATEFEKGGRMLCIRKKKYAFWPINKSTYQLSLTKDGQPDIIYRGIILARRDNCLFQRQLYHQVLINLMYRKSMTDTLNLIIDQILRLVHRQIPWSDLIIIRELGANYKSASYFMKVFSDELRRIDKPANPGDRLEYLIVKSFNVSDKQLLGYKMRLPETYLEHLDSDTPEHLDYEYYIEKILMNCIEQLFQVGYKHDLDALVASYHRKDVNTILTHPSLNDYSNYLQELRLYFQQQLGDNSDSINDHIFNHLLTTKLKYKVSKLRSRFLLRRKQLNTRINHNPIKMLLKIILERRKFLTDIVKLPS